MKRPWYRHGRDRRHRSGCRGPPVFRPTALEHDRRRPVADNSDRMLEGATFRRRHGSTRQRKEWSPSPRKEIVNDDCLHQFHVWAPLIVAANTNDSVTTNSPAASQKCGSADPSVPDSLNIPRNTTPDPRYDGWLSVIDRENGMGYDFWRARREGDGTISYQFGKAWTLDGPGWQAGQHRSRSVPSELAVRARRCSPE